MVVVALLAVVVGQAILANGQVKMTGLQHELSVEQSAHRQAELADANLETPTRIVSYGMTQRHMVAAPSFSCLPSRCPCPSPPRR